MIKTEVLHIESVKEQEAIRRAGQRLREGAIVAFPTETVYGLGAKAEPEVIARLDAIKGRQPVKRYSLHIGNLEDLRRYVPRTTFQTEKLIRKVWPGPVTIIFKPDNGDLEQIKNTLPPPTVELLYQEGTIGVRYPDNPAACAVLAAAAAPIIAPSANPAGQTPAISAEEVMAYFDGKIDMVLDTPGACKYRLNSTVIKIASRGLEVLREGVYTRQEMRDAATVRIVFVCTGNTCRSPMAEALCRKYFADKFKCGLDQVETLGYSIESAGVAACEAMPASFHALEICRQRGTPMDSHRSRGLTEAMIRRADLIFVMNQSHMQGVIEEVAEAGSKCYLLDASGMIADPAGYDLEIYRACADQIERCIQERISEIL